jgi:hypothetical protein
MSVIPNRIEEGDPADPSALLAELILEVGPHLRMILKRRWNQPIRMLGVLLISTKNCGIFNS